MNSKELIEKTVVAKDGMIEMHQLEKYYTCTCNAGFYSVSISLRYAPKNRDMLRRKNILGAQCMNKNYHYQNLVFSLLEIVQKQRLSYCTSCKSPITTDFWDDTANVKRERGTILKYINK